MPIFENATKSGKSGRRIWLRAMVFCAAAVVALAGAYFGYQVAHSNFHTLSPGLVYRSGQIGGEGLSRVIEDFKIKSILNLRGDGTTQDWYVAETETSKRLGISHYDFPLSPGQEVDDAQMTRILALIQDAPKPMLIHCKNGCDRTGLVSALYLYGIEGRPADSASHELSFMYGHVPILFWRDTIAMDRSFWRYVKDHLPQSAVRESRELHVSAFMRTAPLAQ